ncbi:MAG: 6,7-dimethyl-8-ribityllumazine synthase [Alphaproteobacteria bacterium]|nr:6,7-dimethyl-8-ribityllumazine synthase [Alphaproteobacteria bacterium]
MRTDHKAPTPRVPGARIAIIAARYYTDVVDAMIEGARAAIAEAGGEAHVIEVPGAFETPAAIAHLADRYDGFVALGCVVRGETTHYDYVCGESARGLMDLSIRDKVAIGYGILTVETLAQAEVRADRARGDKGGEAARACLTIVALARALRA